MMKNCRFHAVSLVMALTLGAPLTGCSEEQPPAAGPPVDAAVTPAVDASGTPPATDVATPDATPASWTPEALEELLAPVALYPDGVLAQVLASSTNPQEVLDAGNWLIQNPDLKGKELDAATKAAGFTPPMMALMQFPTTVDMMCMNMPWTTELGSAFQADEPGVLEAVQRLRKQAVEMGNLQSSEQMKVETEVQNNQEVVVVESVDPKVVYVPQYDPQAVYTTAAPVATTTTATTTATETGHSTGTLVTTGLLAFGAGILVSEIFEDDDDDYYYPHWGGGGYPYYPPPYRPAYGGGYRPAYGYNRPPNYQHGFNNNNINTGDITINTGNSNYWNNFDKGAGGYNRNKANSPITQARPNRPEMNELNSRSATRSASAKQPGDWKGQSGYAGAKPGARDKTAQTQPARKDTAAKSRPSGTYAGAKTGAKTGTYAGTNKSKAAGTGARDRGYAGATPSKSSAQNASAPRPDSRSKTATQTARAPQQSRKADSGLQSRGSSGKAERSASKRGQSSMKGGGGGRSSGKSGSRHGGGRR